MRLLILKDNAVVSNPSQSTVTVISFFELRQWMKTGVFIKRLFRFQQVELLLYRQEVFSRPFLVCVVLRLLSRGTVSVTDTQGQQQFITLKRLIGYGIQYLRDGLSRNKILQTVQQDVTELPLNPDVIKLDLNKRPIYLRTDFFFNIQSGGSLGHIAGVLNNLDGLPIFFTTDAIPTVNKDIETYLLPLSSRFWDFPEMPTIVSNTLMETFIAEKSSPPAFIYQRYSLYNYVGVKLALHWQVPLILEYNGSEVWISKHWGQGIKYLAVAEHIENLNLRMATLIVVVSQPLKDELIERGIAPNKIMVNPNGVEPTQYSPQIDGSAIRRQYQLENKIVIGFIGTFGPWHGAEVLVDAFSLLLKQYPSYRDNIRLLLIGDGAKMTEVRTKLTQHDIEAYCFLTGIVPQHEGPFYLAACDILVSPHVPNPDGSKFFGSPTKLFEYMAMGKGIVASDLDQIGEVLSHNQTAYLVTPGDPQALANGLKALINDPALRIRLGEAARHQVMAHYTWQQHTQRIMGELERLCQSSVRL